MQSWRTRDLSHLKAASPKANQSPTSSVWKPHTGSVPIQLYMKQTESNQLGIAVGIAVKGA